MSSLGARTLGARIRAARQKIGKKQHELAAAIGCGAQTIWRYEADWTSPNVDTLKRIAEALDVPVAELLEDTPTAAE